MRKFIAVVALLAASLGIGGAASAQDAEIGPKFLVQQVGLDLPPEIPGAFWFRFAGSDRYHTAAITEGIEETPGRILVVANSNGIDALFVGDNLARHGDAYLLPVPATGEVPHWIISAIHDYTDVSQVLIIGGRVAVSDEVAEQVIEAAWYGAGPGL